MQEKKILINSIAGNIMIVAISKKKYNFLYFFIILETGGKNPGVFGNEFHF
jgi:hypothetical protein